MEYLKIWVSSFSKTIGPLKDDEAGRLLRMMLKYAETGEEPTAFEGGELYLWEPVKQGIDAARVKSEKMSENGKKGGRPKAEETEEKQTKANESNGKQTKANESLNVQVNVKDKVKDKVKKVFTPPTVDEVRAYCQERGNGVDPEKFVDFYTSKGWKVGKEPMKDWKASVRTWEGRDKAAPKAAIRSIPAQNYTQRDYDGEQADAMRRMLEGVRA